MRRVWDGVGAGQSGLSVVCARWVGRSAPMFNFPVRSEPGGKIPPRMGMADGSCADSYPLPSDASHQSGFVLGMFGTFGACRASAAAVPVWRGKAGPCEMSRASRRRTLREQIKAVMRHAEPRMFWRRPGLAPRHRLNGFRRVSLPRRGGSSLLAPLAEQRRERGFSFFGLLLDFELAKDCVPAEIDAVPLGFDVAQDAFL